MEPITSNLWGLLFVFVGVPLFCLALSIYDEYKQNKEKIDENRD